MRPGVPFAGVRMSCAGGEFGRRQCRACWGMRSVSHSPVSIFLGPPVVPMRKELAGQAYPAGYVSGRACGFSRPRSCAMGVSRICRSGCRPLWVCASTPFRAQPGDMPVFRGWGSKGGMFHLVPFFLCDLKTAEFQRFVILALGWSASGPASTGTICLYLAVVVGSGCVSLRPVFLV